MNGGKDLERKAKRITNGCLYPIVILLFVYYIFFTLTLDQRDYLKNHKELRAAEAVSVKITGFYTSTYPLIYYSRISRSSDYGIGNERVVRAEGDYVGKMIKVWQLPNGNYIRDRFVFTRRAKVQLMILAFVILVLMAGNVRKKSR